MAKKIKVNIYDGMRRSLAAASAYERGQKVDLRVTEIPTPPKVLKTARNSAYPSEPARKPGRIRRTFAVSVQRQCRAGSRVRDVHKARHYCS